LALSFFCAFLLFFCDFLLLFCDFLVKLSFLMDFNFLLLFPQPLFRPFPFPCRNLSQSRLNVGRDIGGSDGAGTFITGLSVRLPDGDSETSVVGDNEVVGNKLDEGEKEMDGAAVEVAVGILVGKSVGMKVGKLDGDSLATVGDSDGASLGPSENTI
jgi:hypothetical protein